MSQFSLNMSLKTVKLHKCKLQNMNFVHIFDSIGNYPGGLIQRKVEPLVDSWLVVMNEVDLENSSKRSEGSSVKCNEQYFGNAIWQLKKIVM